MKQLLVTEEILSICRISRPTLDRYVSLARRGLSSFPLPIQSGIKRKRLWNIADIEQWLQCHKLPPQIKSAVTNPRQQKKKEQSYQQRQEAMRQALVERHCIIMNPNQ